MTAVPDLMVTLANGDQVPWSEFKTWSGPKQSKNLAPKPVLSEQGRARISEANKNKSPSAETRAKMSATRTNIARPPEVRAKISATNKGRKLTEEQKAKISAANKGRKRSPETRAKISAAGKGKRKGCKPIMTPTGAFPSIRAAIEWATANGLVNARNKIPKWLVTHPDQFYYLPKDTK